MQNLQLYKVATILLFLISCSPPIDKIPDLDNIGSDFNAGKFFKDKIEQTNKTIARPAATMSKKELSKALDENLFVKDTLCYYTSEAFNGQYIHSKSDYSNRNKKHEGIYGYTYTTMSWDKNDSLAVLKGVYFQRLNMLETAKGDLVSLTASNESYSDANHARLISHLNKKYGAAKKLSNNNKKEIIQWKANDMTIQLETTIENVEEVLSIDIYGKKEVKKETEYTLEYYQFTNKYVEDLHKLKIGSWYID